jgi:hypothetical protein
MKVLLWCQTIYIFGLMGQRQINLQNMVAYSYKSQVHIIVASMALHNYIRRKSQEDFAFIEYDHNSKKIF